jgi:hypothetical protein
MTIESNRIQDTSSFHFKANKRCIVWHGPSYIFQRLVINNLKDFRHGTHQSFKIIDEMSVIRVSSRTTTPTTVRAIHKIWYIQVECQMYSLIINMMVVQPLKSIDKYPNMGKQNRARASSPGKNSHAVLKEWAHPSTTTHTCRIRNLQKQLTRKTCLLLGNIL